MKMDSSIEGISRYLQIEIHYFIL